MRGYFTALFDFLRGDPVVHKAEIVIKYKDGSKKTDRPGVAFIRKSDMRERAEEWCENRRNGSEKDEIEKVYYRTRMISILG